MGSGVPTFALSSATFLGFPSFLDMQGVPGLYTIAGIPYDLGTSNRPGARFGPEAIRRASRMLIDGAHPKFKVAFNEGEEWAVDAGDFQLIHGDMIGTLTAICEQAGKHEHLIVLGGDHSITLPLLEAVCKKQGRPVGLLHFDAHLDTWNDNFGGINFGHGNPFWHAIERGFIDPKHMVQIGIRSPVDTEVAQWTLKQGSRIVSAFDVHRRSVFDISGIIEDVLGDYPSYLTLDIDVLDPAFAPGTGTPEIGGLASWQLQAIIRDIRRPVKFVGMDVVEVSPPYDHAEITSLAAATMVWEYLAREVSMR